MPIPEPAVSQAVDWPKWGALLLSAFSLGWQFVNEFRNKRKAKKSYRLARIESFENHLAEARSLAMAYWLQPGESSARDSVMILHHLKELSISATRYANFLWPTASSDVLRFKKAVTGGDFQQANRAAVDANSIVVKNFMAAAVSISKHIKDLRDQLEHV